MNLQSLQVFIAVADKKSFTKPTDDLCLSQSGISKRIASLESDLSSRLFDRSTKMVTLTEAGEALLPAANSINAELTAIKSIFIDPESAANEPLTIGVSDYVELKRITSVFNIYRENFPEVDLEIAFKSDREIKKMVKQGTLDLGVCSVMGNTINENKNDGLCSKELWTEEVRAVVDKQHDLAIFKNVSLKLLCEYPSILPIKTTAIRSVVDKEISQYPTDAITMQTSDMLTIKTMVGCGIGWSFLPKTEIDDSLAALRVDNFPYRHTVRLYHNSNRTISRAAKDFINSIQFGW